MAQFGSLESLEDYAARMNRETNMDPYIAELALVAQALEGQPPYEKKEVKLSRGECLMIIDALRLVEAVRQVTK